jgi:hypothetical protein
MPDVSCYRSDMSVITSRCRDNAAVLHDAAAEVFVSAEKEMAAFYTAVTESYGPEQAELAALDWLREMEQTDWSMADGIPNLRNFTYMAAARLAERICPKRFASYT